MISIDPYMILIVMGVLTFIAFWIVCLYKTIGVALENRRVRRGKALTQEEQEPVLLRATRSWIGFFPLLSVFLWIQAAAGVAGLTLYRLELAGSWAAGFALYSLVSIVLQWLYFEQTTLTVTPTKVIVRSGLIVERRVEIPLDRIEALTITPEQGWFRKGFREESLHIEAEDTSVRLKALVDPTAARSCIEAARERHLQQADTT